MGVFLFVQHGANKEMLVPVILFGVILVAIAIIGLRVEKKVYKGKSIPKIIFGSLALAFALMILIGVLALPFVGFEAFDAIMHNNAGIIWLVLAVIVSPITAKYMR